MMPPARPTIEELREEFRQVGVNGWLWPWVADVLRTYVWLRLSIRYKAAIYSPSGEWDEDGVHDLVQTFIVERCVNKEAVSSALAIAENTAGVVRYLERSMHNFVRSERIRSIGLNIYDRLREVLTDDPRFVALAGMGGRAAYGLVEWSDDPPPVATDEDVSSALRLLPEQVEWREYETGDRQSPGIASSDLVRIALQVITGTNRLWSSARLMGVIRARFDLGPDEQLVTDLASADASTHDISPLDSVVAEDLARRTITALSDEQRRVINAFTSSTPPPTVRQVAATIGMSKSAVSRHLRGITETFNQLHITAAAEQHQLLAAVSKLLAG